MEDEAIIILELLCQVFIHFPLTDVSPFLRGFLTWFRKAMLFLFGNENVWVCVHALVKVWVVVLKKLFFSLNKVFAIGRVPGPNLSAELCQQGPQVALRGAHRDQQDAPQLVTTQADASISISVLLLLL